MCSLDCARNEKEGAQVWAHCVGLPVQAMNSFYGLIILKENRQPRLDARICERK